MISDFAPVSDLEDERLRRKRRVKEHLCRCRVCQPDSGRDIDLMRVK